MLGEPADGLPMDINEMTPVSGAEFTAKRVPGIEPHHTDGTAPAESITLADAGDRVQAERVVARAVTDANGAASLAGLTSGVYFVQEIGVPEGYVASAPFLVQLPFPDPSDLENMLDVVHVYPKNTKVAITLHVNDKDATAVEISSLAI